jgi:hypothetical protein
MSIRSAILRAQVAVVALGIAVGISWPARTFGAVTYSYQGNSFTSVTQPYSVLDAVSGFFSIANPLSDGIHNLSNQPGAITWSFNDGVDTYSNANTGLTAFTLWVSAGQIYNWSIELSGILQANQFETLFTQNYTDLGNIVVLDEGVNLATFPGIAGANTNSPGRWISSASPLPLPKSWMLLPSGLLLFSLFRRAAPGRSRP